MTGKNRVVLPALLALGLISTNAKEGANKSLI